MNEDDKKALRELMARAVAMLERMENIEHRVATMIEGGRQQLGHLVSDLHIREMQHELRDLSVAMKNLVKK